MSSEANPENDQRTPCYKEVDGYLLPGMFSDEVFRSAINYEPRPDDLFIATYPKCGTTWVQNIVACLYRDGKPFSSFQEFLTQTPFLEMVGGEAARTMKRPGAIKVHLPFRLTPHSSLAKYIFVARNPKDVCVSFYHHTRNIPGYNFQNGSFDDYFELFVEGKVDCGDYFDNLLSWYEHRDDPNVLFLTYEELKKDTAKNIKRIAAFMGSEYKEALESNSQLLDDVMLHSSFTFMKDMLNRQLTELLAMPKDLILNHPDIPEEVKKLLLDSAGAFTDKSTHFRKGIVGDWRNCFSAEQNQRLDARFLERTQGTDIPDLWRDCM